MLQKEYVEAASIYQKILNEHKALNLDLLAPLDRLAAIYKLLGNTEKVKETYKEMLAAREKISDDDDDPMLVYPLTAYASCLEKSGDKEEAIKLKNRAKAIERSNNITAPHFAKINPGTSESERQLQAVKMRELGDKMMRRDRSDTAFLYYQQAVLLNPKDALALADKAESETYLNKNESASRDFDKAIELDPNLASAYVGRANLRQSLNHNLLALTDFDNALRCKPKDVETMSAKAKLLTQMGKKAEAIAEYSQIIETDPTLYFPYVERAHVYTSIGEHDKAIADYTVVIERAPKDFEFREYRGDSYFKSGNLVKAQKDFDEMIKLNPGYSSGYRKRALVLEKLDGKKSDRVLADESMARQLLH